MKTLTNIKVEAVQDGAIIERIIIDEYNLSGEDYKIAYSKNEESNIYRSNFVGIVRSPKNDHRILFSMPKHYMCVEKFNKLEDVEKLRHIRLVMKSIKKSIEITEFTQYKHNVDVDGTFAFGAYQGIYNYFQKYGLYYNNKVQYKKGYKQHISWKKTIAKSNKYLVNNKVFMLPLVVRKNQRIVNLITECMIFVLNYTELMYGQFIDLPNTDQVRELGINQYILNNGTTVVSQLMKMKDVTFKDIDLQLIDNLIVFLLRVNSRNKKSISIRDYKYEYVWEQGVESYLNKYFDKVDNDQLLFSDTLINKYQFEKISVKYDLKHKNHTLEPDHYYFNEEKRNLYLFDSKYYAEIKDLNHKQLVYHYIFGNRVNAKNIYNSLIIPTEDEHSTDIHVEVMPEFLVDGKSIKIYQCYLNTIDVINNFIS